MLWLTFACSGSGTTEDLPTDASEPHETGTDTDPTGPTGDTSSTEEHTGTHGTPVALDGVAATVDDEIGSLVWVDWTQDQEADVHLEFSVDPGEWRSSPIRALDAGPHRELLLGVPYDADVTWRVVATNTAGEARTADATSHTDPLPADFPTLTVHTSDSTGQDVGGAPYVFTTLGPPTLSGAHFAFLLDRQARVVWSHRAPRNRVSIHSRVARDGRSLYIDHNSFWASFDLGAGSSVVQMTLDGEVVLEFPTPGMHHPFTDLPDGSLAYGKLEGLLGESVALVRRDLTTQTLWDCQAWLAPIQPGSACQSNTLNHDPATGTFLFSLYTVETIVEIDATTGDTLRWFGHVPSAYAFDPPGSAFWWQHGGHFLPNGHLLTSSDLQDRPAVETVAREYEVDTAQRTLREVWNMDVGAGILGGTMGEAVRLPNGNTWHNFGDLARLREVAPDGTLVWDIEWATKTIGRSMPVVDLYAMAGDRP
ncbi:MAG: hypothetical protein KC621_21110 [Myxococcales bacterium]|nr:hypothetical protein [Myxococcales bacterium]